LYAVTTPAFRYWAFISYSHQDQAWAEWLHRALETYRVPARLVGRQTAAGTIPRRLAPIFRDRDELPTASDLSQKVNEALAQSANLVVICSPRAAASRWANEEVLRFKRLGRSDRIFCLIIDGEPKASAIPGRESRECFVEALRYRLGADGALTREHAEPIAADARPGRDGRGNAKLKLIAGLLDVGFDELRQRELHRRIRRMTAIAAVAVMVMLLTTALAIDAVIARRAAERHQKSAEDLVDFMLGDLNDKLEKLQRLDIMEAVDDKAMAYFKALPSGDVTDDTLTHRAKALEKIGSVRTDQGHLAAAMESYQAALRLAAALAKEAPANTQRQLAYAREWTWIGMIDWHQGDLAAADRDFESARQIVARAQGHDPHDLPLRFESALLDNNVGHVLEAQGRLEEAAAQYRQQLEACLKLAAAKPDDKDYATELGSAHNNLGKLALMSGDLRKAIEEYRADDAIEAQLSARDPKDNDQIENVVTVRAILGRTLALTGDLGGGMHDLGQSVALAAKLASFDPQIVQVQEDLALYSSQLARLKRLTGDLPAATDLTHRSVSIYTTLVRTDPSNSRWQREFAEAQTEQALESLAAGRADAARTQSQAALALLEPLLQKQPDERAMLLATARARLLLAAVALDRDSARRLRSDALGATESISSGRADPRLLALQAQALIGLGRASDARPLLVQLSHSGFGDPEFLSLLRSQHVDYPPQDGTGQRQAVVAK
jgi:eukaryotic-like serine/threonine-protein kinase